MFVNLKIALYKIIQKTINLLDQIYMIEKKEPKRTFAQFVM